MNRLQLSILQLVAICAVLVVTGAGCPPSVPELAVSDSSHSFAAGEDSWSFQVWNDGPSGTVLTFTLTAEPNWITVDPDAGQSQDDTDRVTIAVTIVHDNLSGAVSSGTITIHSNAGAQEVDIQRKTTGGEGENVFYVSGATGNDFGTGSLADPWRTIQQAADTLTAGQTVYIMEGTYEERVIPRRSGTPGNYIVYSANPGELITIDGANIPLPDDLVGLFEVNNCQYIQVTGLRIINAGPNLNNAGILVNNSSHVTIDRNITVDSVSSGIGVWTSDNIIIDNNEVELACNDGEQECITVAGTETFVVSYNTVHNNGGGTIGGEGIDLKDGSSNGLVHHNHVYDLHSRLGIYIEAWDKHTFDIHVYQNEVHDIFSADGIAVSSEMGGLLENVHIFNNVVYGAGCNGIAVARNGDSATHPMNNITIINNTIFNNGGPSCYGGEWGGAIFVSMDGCTPVRAT